MDPPSPSAGPEPDTDSSAAPPADRVRPVGGTEYSWCRAVPGGTGTTVLALCLSGPTAATTPANLQNVLQTLQNCHPVLRAHLHLSPPSHAFLSFPSSPSPLLLTSKPAPESEPVSSPESAFHSLLEHELARNPWAGPECRAPVFFATLYELSDPGRVALFVRIHTAVCDRAAAEGLGKELIGLLGGGGGDPDPEVAAVEAGVEERIPKGDTWKPFWARGLDMVGYSINGLRTSMLRFEETGSERCTRMVRFGLGRQETTRLLDACKVKGVKLCAAIAAATLLAAHSSNQLESGQQETYSVVTLINCRKFLQPVLDDHNVGFYHSAITNTHTVHGGEGLWELAKRCHDSYSHAKNNKKHLTDISDLNFLMCRAIENPQLTTASALRTALISVFEEPAVYELSDLQRKLGIESYVCCATVHGIGPSIGVFDTIRDGQLDCVCMYPSLHSRKQMQEIFEQVKQILIQGSRVDEENFEDCT